MKLKKTTYKTDQNHPQIRAYIDAVEKGKKNYHVLFRDGKWIVKKPLTDKINHISNTQEEAIEYGESIAMRDKVTLFVLNNDWDVQDRKDFQNSAN